MAGITRTGAYVPLHRLTPASEGWAGTSQRTVANFDEDAITMAVAAVEDCLTGTERAGVDAIYLASTTLPYLEKQAATVVATAADLADDLFATDISHSLRSGTNALLLALDAVGAGRLKRALVVASDGRLGPPGSDFEKAAGDGAVCFEVGAGDELAVFEGAVSVAHEIHDVWRAAGDTMVRSWEDRFVQQEGYLDAIRKVADLWVKKTGRALETFDRIVLYAPDARRHAEAARMLGIAKEKLQDPLFGRMGNTGAAFALAQLAAALEAARAGETILVINYGDGADAMAFRVGAAPQAGRTGRRGLSGSLAGSRPVPAYADYLKWRGLFSEDGGVRRPAVSGPSAAALHREQDQVLRFKGVRCTKCTTVMYPPQRICVECNARDQFAPVRLAGEPAKLFTYSMDYIAGSVDVPLVLTVVDFDNGARAVLMMTDRDVDRVAIDMPLELTFRLARSGGGITNYYWKAMPTRESFAAP
ncbi:MAG: OB-fold domain-containing protein [Dehalococcoidia bacterium]